MRSWLKRTGKRILLVLVALGICGGLWFGLSRLKRDNYLWWATGTRDRAFLCTTWQMSPSEVERATGHPLHVEAALPLLWVIDSVRGLDPVDEHRFRAFCQNKCYTLWGNRADVSYVFFDRQLYLYEVTLTTYDGYDLPIIAATLAGRFGKARVLGQGTAGPSRMEWRTQKQRVTLSSFRTGDRRIGYEYAIVIHAVYIPLESRIRQVAREEKERYF